MTGGRVVVLGPTGRNFAAGMSGGIAYVLDEEGDFEKNRCNPDMVELSSVDKSKDIDELRTLIENHSKYTKSAKAKRILHSWEDYLPKFIKVMPTDYRLALEEQALEREKAKQEAEKDTVALSENQQ